MYRQPKNLTFFREEIPQNRKVLFATGVLSVCSSSILYTGDRPLFGGLCVFSYFYHQINSVLLLAKQKKTYTRTRKEILSMDKKEQDQRTGRVGLAVNGGLHFSPSPFLGRRCTKILPGRWERT